MHGPGMDQPLVWFEGTDDATPRYLTSDQLGSITAVTDASGNALSLNSYNEYGRLHTNAAYQGRFGYTGQAYLPEIGLYNYKNRMYAPSLGRFLQPDPIGYGDGLNIYAYVHGDPVNYTDPWGTCTITAIWKQFPNKEEIVDGTPVVYVRPDQVVGYRATGCGPGMSGLSTGSGSGENNDGSLGTVVVVHGAHGVGRI
jgi:RHS repeat-associated protein